MIGKGEAPVNEPRRTPRTSRESASFNDRQKNAMVIARFTIILSKKGLGVVGIERYG